MKHLVRKIRKLTEQRSNTRHGWFLVGSRDHVRDELSKEDLDYLRQTTGLQDPEIQKRYKVFLKDHPSGFISPDSFDKILSLCLNDPDKVLR